MRGKVYIINFPFGRTPLPANIVILPKYDGHIKGITCRRTQGHRDPVGGAYLSLVAAICFTFLQRSENQCIAGGCNRSIGGISTQHWLWCCTNQWKGRRWSTWRAKENLWGRSKQQGREETQYLAKLERRAGVSSSWPSRKSWQETKSSPGSCIRCSPLAMHQPDWRAMEK